MELKILMSLLFISVFSVSIKLVQLGDLNNNAHTKNHYGWTVIDTLATAVIAITAFLSIIAGVYSCS